MKKVYEIDTSSNRITISIPMDHRRYFLLIEDTQKMFEITVDTRWRQFLNKLARPFGFQLIWRMK